MNAAFDTLAATDALEQSGMDSRQAHACAAQMDIAVKSVDAVTPEQFNAGLAQLKAELLACIAESEQRIQERIAGVELRTQERIAAVELRTQKCFADLQERIAGVELRTQERIAESEQRTQERIAESEQRTQERIAESEQRMREHVTTLLWRFFGAMVALAGLAVAALRYLPPPAAGG